MKEAKKPSFRPFYLYRIEDVSGVSGVGIVGEGIQYSSGQVVLAWVVPDKPSSLAVHESIASLKAVHGHEGKTKVIWADPVETDIETLDLDNEGN